MILVFGSVNVYVEKLLGGAASYSHKNVGSITPPR